MVIRHYINGFLAGARAASWPRRWRLAWVGPVLLLCGCASVPPAPVTPERPSYSSDTGTTAFGTLELEAGVLVGDESRVDTPVTVKWGTTESSELFFGWSPYLRVASRAGDESGVGDLVLGTRVRFAEEDQRHPSAAVQLAAKLPTADDGKGLGTGLVDFFAAAIATRSLGRTTFNGFYQLGALSDPAGGNVIVEHGFAVAVGHPIVRDLGGFTELSLILTPEQKTEAVLWIVGAGYPVHPDIAFDSALFVGLTEDASKYAFTVGTTVNLGGVGSWFGRGGAERRASNRPASRKTPIAP
jgi:hypothetical protein